MRQSTGDKPLLEENKTLGLRLRWNVSAFFNFLRYTTSPLAKDCDSVFLAD